MDSRTAAPIPGALRARRILAATGAWMMVLVALGHLLLAELAAKLAGPGPEEAEALRVMSGVFPMEGVAHSMADFALGNSLGMGFAVLGLGALNLAAIRAFRGAGLEMPRGLLVVDALAAAALLAISIAFFPLPPIVFLVVATLGFGGAAALPATSR